MESDSTQPINQDPPVPMVSEQSTPTTVNNSKPQVIPKDATPPQNGSNVNAPSVTNEEAAVALANNEPSKPDGMVGRTSSSPMQDESVQKDGILDQQNHEPSTKIQPQHNIEIKSDSLPQKSETTDTTQELGHVDDNKTGVNGNLKNSPVFTKENTSKESQHGTEPLIQSESSGHASDPRSNTSTTMNNHTEDASSTNSNGAIEPEQDPQLTTKSLMNSLLFGKCKLQHLPALPKKVVRIFISSTFTDTKEERNALMEHVYPKLADHCKEKHGLEFQVVDMRWGVPDQALDNHSTTDLCLQEIHKCQEVSVGPNFVAIIGDKYGYRPIPTAIARTLFDTLADIATASDDLAKKWEVVKDWYKEDTNVLPAKYMLQSISSKLVDYHSEVAEKRTKAQSEWNDINKTLTEALREASTKALERGLIKEEEREQFFISVTENEITSGVIRNSTQASGSTFCIMRQIQDVADHLSEPKAPKFTDITPNRQLDKYANSYLTKLKNEKLPLVLPHSNFTRLSIDWSFSGANISVENMENIDIAKYAQQMMKDKEMNVFKHKEYLDDVCSRFFKNITRMIQQGSARERQVHDDLSTEVLQHMHLAKDRCYVFEGREEVLEKAMNYIETDNTTHPFVIHGSSGCGKTSVVAKIIDQILNKSETTKEYVLVARFLGTSTNSCNLHQLLVSLCQQLSVIYGKEWHEPDELQHLIAAFHSLMGLAKGKETLVLILDSVDQMLPTYNAYKLQWLPKVIPENVKIIVSTIGEDYPILSNFKTVYKMDDDQLIEIKPLGEFLGLKVIKKWLELSHRTCAPHQEEIIKQALARCSLPLYARIAFDYITKWRSFDVPLLDDLEASVQGAINKLFTSMEQKFGLVIVKHCLAYLTASRNGLSETELEHVLSMDDTLLNTVFQFWKPPVRRLPSLIWTRIRNEVNNYIVQRSADDILVIYWYHRQFIQVTKKRYLSEPAFSVHVHTHLAEFFSGKWNAGKKKPFAYTEAQMKRFGLESAQSEADRKLPSQPYCSEVTTHGSTTLRFNKRKMSELPFHLVKSKNYEELKQSVFFNFEWLFNKLRGFSVQQMLEEFEVFMQSDKLLGKDKELKLLYVNLQMMRPDLIRYPNSLSYELQGTLSKFLGKHDHITHLVKQCDAIGSVHCAIVPLFSCFKSADLGFAQNINFRRKDPQQPGGACVCSSDFGTLFLVDYDREGKPVLLTYDMLSGDKVKQVKIKKDRPVSELNSTDIYCQIELVCDGEKLIAFYKIKDEDVYQGGLRKGSGFVDLIDVSTGQVLHSFDCFMYRDEFLTPLVYATNNHMCVINGWKMPLINVKDNSTQSFNRATYLNKDETFLVVCNKDKTIIREHESKELVGDCDLPESQIAVTASDDFTVIAIMGSETKNISIFDLSNKQMKTKKRFFQMFKPKHVFKLDAHTKRTIETVSESVTHVNEKGRTEEVTNNRVFMKISPDRRHLLVVFIGWKWVAFMWCLNIGRYSAKFVGNITGTLTADSKLPQFNHNGSSVIFNTDLRHIVVVSTDTGQTMNEFTMQEDIKDICISRTGNKMAIMLQKNVAILNTGAQSESTQEKTKKDATEDSTRVLLERELSWKGVSKEVICRQEDGKFVVEEIDDLAEAVDTDRIASARSKRQYAIAKYVSPNGNKVVHFHSRVQVIDTKADEVRYTPLKKDSLLRVHVEQGISSNKIIPIPGLQDTSRMAVMDILQGDRIVNENNKIKFRSDKEPNGQFKIMTVPSVLTVYTTEEIKLRRAHRIDAYKEIVLYVGNNHILTTKRTQFGHFVNIYELREGKLLATHKCTTIVEKATMNKDETTTYVIDRSFTLRVIHGPSFTTISQQFTLTAKTMSAAFIIKGLVVFPRNPDRVLIQYGPEGSSRHIQSRYIMFDTSSGSQSTEITVTWNLQDITTDGELGIDAMLNMFDLPNGKIIRRIPYKRQDDSSKATKSTDVKYVRHEDDQSTSLSARISEDKRCVVFIDKLDRSMHLASIDGYSAKLIAECNSHVTTLISDRHFVLRCSGNVIALKSDEAFMCFAIGHQTLKDNAYSDERSRALGIVENIKSTYAEKNGHDDMRAKDEKSVFERRALLLNQMGTKSTHTGKSSKPTCLFLGDTYLVSNIFDVNFTKKIDAWKVPCQNVGEILSKFDDSLQYVVDSRYNVIVIQLTSTDVAQTEVDAYVSKVKDVTDKAKQHADHVVISQAILRSDNRDANDKILDILGKLDAEYNKTSASSKSVLICDHSNLYIDNKPSSKSYEDGTHLSKAGFLRLSTNLKIMLAPLFQLHHI